MQVSAVTAREGYAVMANGTNLPEPTWRTSKCRQWLQIMRQLPQKKLTGRLINNFTLFSAAPFVLTKHS